MWDYRVFFILFYCSSVLCDDCVTFDFEKDFNSSFSNKIGVCDGRPMWNVGRYEYLPINAPDPGSTKFVYPNEILSCASSFSFQMAATGILEINIFMEPTVGTDQVTIHANQIVPGGNDAVVGNIWIIAMADDFVSGWRTARIRLTGFGTYSGYITILGMAAADSIILVDSFRYIAPTITEEECIIYENNYTTTIKTTQTDEITSTPTTQPSSPYTTTINPELTTTETIDSNNLTTPITKVQESTTTEFTSTNDNDMTTQPSSNIYPESTTNSNTDDTTESTTGMTAQTITTQSDDSSPTDTTASTTDESQVTTSSEPTTAKECESISTAEVIEPDSTEPTYSPVTEGTTSITTVIPANPDKRFWNAYTVTMVIILILIILIIVAVVWYYIGKRSELTKSQIILPYFEAVPKTLTIPRVTKIRTDASTINRISSIIKIE